MSNMKNMNFSSHCIYNINRYAGRNAAYGIRMAVFVFINVLS
jgi:hypothetical protein